MVRGREWTGFEAVALQEAMRRSVRDFAALLGLETTTVNNWRTGLGGVTPRTATQAILDTTYQQRATDDDRSRFEQIVAEGEAVWRTRHQSSARRVTSAENASGTDHLSTAQTGHEESTIASGFAPFRSLSGVSTEQAAGNGAHGSPPRADQGTSEDLIEILSRIHKLSRSVNPEIIRQLQGSTRQSIASYETIDPSGLVPALKKQRAWLDTLLDECNHPQQRQQLFEVAGETSGLLGYIAVGSGSFSLARAYCLESFQLGDYVQDGNLKAWARGMQSFCEYYAGRYEEALRYAEDGIAHAGSGPQSVRLAINGVARAMGKRGDVEVFIVLSIMPIRKCHRPTSPMGYLPVFH